MCRRAECVGQWAMLPHLPQPGADIFSQWNVDRFDRRDASTLFCEKVSHPIFFQSIVDEENIARSLPGPSGYDRRQASVLPKSASLANLVVPLPELCRNTS